MEEELNFIVADIPEPIFIFTHNETFGGMDIIWQTKANSKPLDWLWKIISKFSLMVEKIGAKQEK